MKKFFGYDENLSRENEKLRRLLKEAEGAVADCRRAGETLDSRNLLKNIVDNSTAVIYVKDLEGRFLLVNRRFGELFHISPEAAVGKTDHDLFPEDMADAYRAFDRQVMDAGTTLESEEAVPQDDGLHIYISIKSPLLNHEGKPYGLFGISTDITDRKKAEEERLSYLRFLENLERIDRAIRQADNLEKMMTDVLDTALSIFDSDRAWLLYPCDPEADTWSIPMERTREGYPGAFELKVQFPKVRETSEVFQTALDSDDPVVFDPRSGRLPPGEIAERFSVRSQILIAVYPKHGRPWLFGMHQCSHPRVWTDEDVRLFREIGRRVADGLSSLLFLRDLQAEEHALKNTHEELQKKVKELEKFIRLTVGRELRIVELKEEIKRLRDELFRRNAA